LARCLVVDDESATAGAGVGDAGAATRAGGGLRRRPRLGRIERRRPRQQVPSAQSRGGEELRVLALALAPVVCEADRARDAVGGAHRPEAFEVGAVLLIAARNGTRDDLAEAFVHERRRSGSHATRMLAGCLIRALLPNVPTPLAHARRADEGAGRAWRVTAVGRPPALEPSCRGRLEWITFSTVSGEDDAGLYVFPLGREPTVLMVVFLTFLSVLSLFAAVVASSGPKARGTEGTSCHGWSRFGTPPNIHSLVSRPSDLAFALW
jgi:hypothetical protein